MATLAGRPVDRPPVCFYELNGLDERPEDADSFNIYNHPSWTPLIELTRERTDRIVMRSVPFRGASDPLDELTQIETWFANGSRYERLSLQCGRRTLTATTRRDPEVNTIWQIEHLLKDVDDLQTYLELPQGENPGEPDCAGVLEAEQRLGDSGIVMIDTPDPLCLAASLFDMASYTVVAATEQRLFHRLLDRFAETLQPRTEAIAQVLPGRLWRIYGPEYASPPYLRPHLFREYVVGYDAPLVKAIQRTGGFARIHSHGRLRLILDDIASTACDGLDPIEPPPQGDVTLAEVRERYGQQMVLFGNLEASDIEGLDATDFEAKVQAAVDEGCRGTGRGFVLMPSSIPYGRVLSERALKNFELMVQTVEQL